MKTMCKLYRFSIYHLRDLEFDVTTNCLFLVQAGECYITRNTPRFLALAAATDITITITILSASNGARTSSQMEYLPIDSVVIGFCCCYWCGSGGRIRKNGFV